MLHSVPLLEWLEQNTAGITWWLWGLIFVLSALAINTLFCSVESIIRKRGATHWLLLISRQIIHIGFLFMHLKREAELTSLLTDWNVDVEYILDGKSFKKDTIRPNSPSLLKGYNVNVKDLRLYPRKMILLQVNKEPGAIWALIGGILFMIGITTLLMLKIRMEK